MVSPACLVGITSIDIAVATHGGAVIAHNADVCFVIVGTHSVDTIRRISAGLDVDVKTRMLDETLFFNVWFQPEFCYLQKLLPECGLDDWASQLTMAWKDLAARNG